MLIIKFMQLHVNLYIDQNDFQNRFCASVFLTISLQDNSICIPYRFCIIQVIVSEAFYLNKLVA